MPKKVTAPLTKSRKPAPSESDAAGGFVSIRMSQDLRRLIAIEAEREDRSQSKWVQRLIRSYFVGKYKAPLDNEGCLTDPKWQMPPEG